MDGGEGSTGRGGGGGAVPDYDDDNYSEDNMYQDNDYDDNYDNYEEVNDGDSGDNNMSESQNNDNNKDIKEIAVNADQVEIDRNNFNKSDIVICNENIDSVNIIKNENIASKDVKTNGDAPKNVPLTKDIKMKKKVLLTRAQKHRKMTEALCDVLGDFGLVSFLPMNIQDAQVC